MKYSQLNYNDRTDLRVARDLLQRNPAVIPLLMGSISENLAITILKTAKDETNKTMEIIRSFVTLAEALEKRDKQVRIGKEPTDA